MNNGGVGDAYGLLNKLKELYDQNKSGDSIVSPPPQIYPIYSKYINFNYH